MYTISKNEQYGSIEIAFDGKPSAEVRDDLRDKAIRFQHSICEAEGLYMSEYAVIMDWFDKNARRFGLLKEFRENGIC